MKIAIVNRSDARGGAAVVSRRLMHALRDAGANARMLVAEKLTNDPYVEAAASPARVRVPFLLERARVFAANGFNRADLFKVDPATDGLPLWRHPLIAGADAVLLNWVNQGMLSLDGVDRIASAKPVIWTMHDLWNATGICHHTGACERFRENCGFCPLLGSNASACDLSHSTYIRKKSLYTRRKLHFVAVSNWLERRCRESSLMRDAAISVIPNPFMLPERGKIVRSDASGRLRAVIAAARLDDDIKGFPILLEALRRLKNTGNELAGRLDLILCGDIRDKGLLQQIPVAWEWKGSVPPDRMPEIYSGAQLVVSSSRYETLPGTLVEGQAYGAFPVAFDRGGQRDIIDDRITGVLAPFGSDDNEAAENLTGALVSASEIVDSADPQELADRLWKSVHDRFSAANVAEAYLGLITDCLSVK